MKEVDIYCEWIDEAHAINANKQKSIGLVDASDEDESVLNDEEESKELPATKIAPKNEVVKEVARPKVVEPIVKKPVK